jgi:hypothetical protein
LTECNKFQAKTDVSDIENTKQFKSDKTTDLFGAKIVQRPELSASGVT